jgi:hypothetical protein
MRTAFVGLRKSEQIAHILSAGSVRVCPFAKLYAITGTGLGVSGGLAVERWSDLWVMRSASYANWVHNTAATSWSQIFILGYAHAVIQERSYDRFADGRDLGGGMAGQLLVSGDRISRTSRGIQTTTSRRLVVRIRRAVGQVGSG